MKTQGLNRRELRAWRAFIQMQEVLFARLDQQFQASGLSHADYTVLAALSETPEGRLRPYEFARMSGWEKSRLHHQLTRMSKRGLIVRERCGSRGMYAVITSKGLTAIENAAPSHADEVRRLFIDCLTPEQLDQFAELSNIVLDNLQVDRLP